MYFAPNIIRVIRTRRIIWVGHVARMDAYSILVGSPEGKRPLGKSRRRLNGNIKMYLKEIGRWYGVGLSGLGFG